MPRWRPVLDRRALARAFWPPPYGAPGAVLYDPWRGRNPVFLRELAQCRRWLVNRRKGALGLLTRIGEILGMLLLGGYLCVGVATFGYMTLRSPDPWLFVREVIAGIAALTTIMLPLLAFAGAAPLRFAAIAITAERERGTWDLLRATPLGETTILLGKLVAIAQTAPVSVAVLVLLPAVQLTALVLTIIFWSSYLPAWFWALALGASLAAAPLGIAALVSGISICLLVSTLSSSSTVAGGVANFAAMPTHFLPAPLMIMAISGFSAYALGPYAAPEVLLARTLPAILIFIPLFGLFHVALAAGLLRLTVRLLRR